MAQDSSLEGATPQSKILPKDAFLENAKKVLTDNDVGAFIKPGKHQYPHQWNWDAALIALGLSHFDLPRAYNEVRSLLRGQWQDGMIPHVVYHNGASDYFPTPEFWQTENSPHAPEIMTSGIVQPPLLATCVRTIVERAEDREGALAFTREVFPVLLRWHRWLHRARDPEGTGLCSIIHPWESGTDNAARWVEPLSRMTPTEVPPYKRRDFAHVKPEERPIFADYERFIYLIGLFRKWAYDPQTIYQKSPFLVQDTLFNALVYRAEEDLKALGEAIGEDVTELTTWLRRSKRAFDYKLWDENDGLYYAYDVRGQRLLRENSCATFLPLFAGIPSEEHARRLVEDHLLNPAEYAPDSTSRYYLPTQAKNNYFYEPRRYWRGPVWIIINYLVMEGLKRYGYTDLAHTIRQHSLELMQSSGFVEYYDPRDGSGAGAVGFSWSAAIALELLSDY